MVFRFSEANGGENEEEEEEEELTPAEVVQRMKVGFRVDFDPV